MIDWFWPFVLISVVGAACFYGGWRAASAYLSAATAVSAISASIVAQSNDFTSSLDKAKAEGASLRADVNRLTEVVNVRQGNVEEAVRSLLQGLERSGIARSPRATPGRQVGEEGPQ
jgi:hypothetical protein